MGPRIKGLQETAKKGVALRSEKNIKKGKFKNKGELIIMSRANFRNQNESTDVIQVDTAVRALQNGDDVTAEKLLLEVIQRTPSHYVYQFEDAGTLYIKFWDQAEFMHYIAFLEGQGEGAKKQITWLGSAYPRAFYYLGFLRVKAKKYSEAISFLDRGIALEPNNPKLIFEKAMALFGMQSLEQALTLYDSVNKVSPHVSSNDIARALRGRGGIFIEIGLLDRAEEAFRESLKIEADNKLALNELIYINQLRRGGTMTPSNLTSPSRSSTNKCAICGQTFTEGHLSTINGKTVFVCKSCKLKESK